MILYRFKKSQRGACVKNYLVRHFAALTLVVFGLISASTLVRHQGDVGYAQASSPGWTYTGNLNLTRFEHTATLLPNGTVLVAGGASNGLTNTAELYDPATGTWRSTGSLHSRRIRHTATLLPNGKVLVAGGLIAWSGPVGTPPVPPTNSAELYDPATETWSLTGSMNSRRAWHSATLLRNGKVLVVGGLSESGYNFWSNSLATAETYDPATGSWSVTGSLHTGRVLDTSTLLQSGMVLVVGGSDTIYSPATNAEEIGNILTSAELYDPGTESWRVTGDLNTPRCVHTATLLPNSKVLVVGGGGPYIGYFIQINNTSELYDPATGTWGYAGNLTGRWHHTATLLPNGQVLVAGGANFTGESDDPQWVTLKSSETYNPTTGNWSATANLNVPRFLHTMTLLSNGNVLSVGGFIGCCDLLGSAELYDSGSSSPANPIDDPQFFVQQQYLDFLNREPDPSGFAFWTQEITSCGGDPQCIEVKRINVSAAFFLSIEFQETGFLAYRYYKAAYGNLPNQPVPIRFDELIPDAREIGRGVIVNQAGWEQVLETNKQSFTAEFTQRARFTNLYPSSMSASEFVDTLNQNSGNLLSSSRRDLLVSNLSSGAMSRAQVLRAIAEDRLLVNAEFNRAFVLMQYFGYLRRNPSDAPDGDFTGYNFWLNKLNQFNGNYQQAEMVEAFLSSTEYRQRFGS